MEEHAHFADVKDHYLYAVQDKDGSTTRMSITGKELKEEGLKDGERYARLQSCIDDERKREGE